MARLALVAVVLVLAPVAAAGRTGSGDVIALLANRELLRVDSASGRVKAKAALGPVEPHAAAVGSYLALWRGRLLVLAPPDAEGAVAQSVAVLDPVSLRRTGSVALPPGIVFRSLQVGRRTGRLFVSGNAGNSASVCVGAQAVSPRWRCVVVRPAGRLDWRVLDSSLSPDERRLLVSYHGGNTTGADVVSTATLARCRPSGPEARATCLSLHGRALFRGDRRVIATTGEGPLLELSPAGARLGEWSLGLTGNHVMEIALSPDGTHAVAVGSCGYAGGLADVDLRAGSVRVLGHPRRICGERVAFVGAGKVAVARNRVPVPQGSPARLDLVDLATGRIVTRHATPSEVVDLLSPVV